MRSGVWEEVEEEVILEVALEVFLELDDEARHIWARLILQHTTWSVPFLASARFRIGGSPRARLGVSRWHRAADCRWACGEGPTSSQRLLVFGASLESSGDSVQRATGGCRVDAASTRPLSMLPSAR